MFETKIQEAWEDYHQDYGLGRILLILIFYNSFLFFLSGSTFKSWQFEALFPVGFAFLYYLLRHWLIKRGPTVIFTCALITLTISILLNYYLIGQFDQSYGGLTRQDPLFYQFDKALFGGPISTLFEIPLKKIGILGNIFYDLLMLSYCSYFLLPIIGASLYFKTLPNDQKFKISRYFFSLVLFFSLNYLLYLAVPVTGPQYWLTDLYSEPLPFTPFGLKLWQAIREGQTTFIDCFPSGHTGLSYLVTIWLFRTNHWGRFFILGTTCFIILATLALRFHYSLDVLCAYPLAYFCHRFSWFFFPVDIQASTLRKTEVS